MEFLFVINHKSDSSILKKKKSSIMKGNQIQMLILKTSELGVKTVFFLISINIFGWKNKTLLFDPN